MLVRAWLVSALTLLLVACGFHLRGEALIPEKINTLYVQSAHPTSTANRSLVRALKDSGVIIANSPKSAKAILTVVSRHSDQTLASLSGASEAGRYRLNAYITFRVKTPSGKMLLPATQVSASKLYSTNAMQVLSEDSIKSRLQSQLLEQLNEAVINHLASLKP